MTSVGLSIGPGGGPATVRIHSLVWPFGRPGKGGSSPPEGENRRGAKGILILIWGASFNNIKQYCSLRPFLLLPPQAPQIIVILYTKSTTFLPKMLPTFARLGLRSAAPQRFTAVSKQQTQKVLSRRAYTTDREGTRGDSKAKLVSI